MEELEERSPVDATPVRARDWGKGFSLRVEQRCIPTIEKATVALVGVQNDKFVHDRTGVLFRFAGHHFILTAAHAGDGTADLRAYNDHHIPWYVSLNVSSVLPISLNGVTIYLTETRGRDIAAIYLPDVISNKILEHREFVQQNQILVEEDWQSGQYVLFGYPMKWLDRHENHTSLYSHRLVYLCPPYIGEIPTGENHDPAVHFALSFEREAFEMSESSPSSLPEPKGISGCGVWRIGDRTERGWDSVATDKVALVGIQHSWSGQRGYVRGTRIAYVLERISDDFPDVKRALGLYFRRQPKTAWVVRTADPTRCTRVIEQ